MSGGDSGSTKSQRSWGNGFFSGLKAAGITNPREFMNSTRLKAMESSLNSIARKVYDAMPPDVPQNAASMCRLMSENGVRIELSVCQGVMNTLKEKKLVKETDNAVFVRPSRSPAAVASMSEITALKAVSPSTTEEEETMNAPVPAPSAGSDVNPLEKIAALSGKFRGIAGQLNEIADELDTVGLDVAAYIQKTQQDNAKMTQLKSLLKELA